VRADSPAPAKAATFTLEVRRAGKAADAVSGTLVKWDDTTITLHAGGSDLPLNWADLTGASAYACRSQLIDKKDAQAWLKLGTLAWGLNDARDGKVALAQAAKLDPSLKADSEAVQASSAGVLLEPTSELMHQMTPGEAKLAADTAGPGAGVVKYHKTTPAEAKAELARIRGQAALIGQQMKINFKEVETDHFLVFTDWPESSYAFIKENVEAANTCVSKQFNIPPTENVFVGKLGVFMFENHADFMKFGETYDHLPAVNAIAGYFTSGPHTMPHMAMSKPDFGKGHEKEIEWAYVLTHEFMHAFVSRYRSSRHIPTWLNEGLAEVVASGQFPRDVRRQAAAVAKANLQLAPLFNDHAGPQPGAIYPVMRTLTEVLIQKDRKKFLAMFDEIKAGATGATALQDNFNMTFDQLETQWRTQYSAVR
jgi:hypothetical protein